MFRNLLKSRRLEKRPIEIIDATTNRPHFNKALGSKIPRGYLDRIIDASNKTHLGGKIYYLAYFCANFINEF